MKQKLNLAVMGLALVCFSPLAQALNNAPPDADTVTLRVSCTEGGTEIPNCFDSMSAVDQWLVGVRQTGPTRPALVNIGPGRFAGWNCTSSHVTLKGSGRDRTVLYHMATIPAGIQINSGCTQLNVQDLTVDGTAALWGVNVTNVSAITAWTNVEIIGSFYAWIEFVTSNCPNHDGKHSWFSSRIRAIGTATGGTARAYGATCAQSWFWGSEIVSEPLANTTNAFALEAHGAEVHLYGSDVRLLLKPEINAMGFGSGGGGGHYLIAALEGSEVHIHGTGLDVMHDGTGTADMLYADADIKSHFHATASGFNIHLGGTGKVKRLAGTGRIEAPYTWGERTTAPLSTKSDGTPTPNGVGTLVSRNGADRYIETDCQPSGNCSSGGGFPHDMVYLTACTGLAANQGPWFDMTTKACRQ